LHMTLYQFTLLNEAEQQAVFRKSALVGKISRNGYAYECRQVDYFYVEWRIEPTTGQYLCARTFTNPDGLQRYLEDIDISAALPWGMA
jgi:hypothetical protein